MSRGCYLSVEHKKELKEDHMKVAKQKKESEIMKGEREIMKKRGKNDEKERTRYFKKKKKKSE